MAPKTPASRLKRSLPYFASPVTGVLIVPAAVLRATSVSSAQPPLAVAGFALFVAGLAFSAWSVIEIFRGGSDPTLARPRELVDTGPYRYSRNPMYVAVIVMVLGETVLFTSPFLLVYAFVLMALLQIVVLKVEEPRIKEALGEEYREYREEVPRWI